MRPIMPEKFYIEEQELIQRYLDDDTIPGEITPFDYAVANGSPEYVSWLQKRERYLEEKRKQGIIVD